MTWWIWFIFGVVAGIALTFLGEWLLLKIMMYGGPRNAIAGTPRHFEFPPILALPLAIFGFFSDRSKAIRKPNGKTVIAILLWLVVLALLFLLFVPGCDPLVTAQTDVAARLNTPVGSPQQSAGGNNAGGAINTYQFNGSAWAIVALAVLMAYVWLKSRRAEKRIRSLENARDAPLTFTS